MNELFQDDWRINMKIEAELKPCPFCGCKHIEFNTPQIDPQIHYQVYCVKCGCGTMGYPDKVKVIKIWNTRI